MPLFPFKNREHTWHLTKQMAGSAFGPLRPRRPPAHGGLQQCWGFTTLQMVWVNAVRGNRRDGWMDGVNAPGPPALAKHSVLHKFGGKKGLHLARTYR